MDKHFHKPKKKVKSFSEVMYRFDTDNVKISRNDLEKALDYDQVHFRTKMKFTEGCKKRLKQVSIDHMEKMSENQTLKEENKQFLDSYKKIENFINNHAIKNHEENPKEIAFKDLVNKYKELGYKIPSLSSKSNLFQQGPLLLENQEIDNYYKSIEIRAIKNDKDLGYILKVRAQTSSNEKFDRRSNYLKKFTLIPNQFELKGLSDLIKENEKHKEEINNYRTTLNDWSNKKKNASNFLKHKFNKPIKRDSNMFSVKTSDSTHAHNSISLLMNKENKDFKTALKTEAVKIGSKRSSIYNFRPEKKTSVENLDKDFNFRSLIQAVADNQDMKNVKQSTENIEIIKPIEKHRSMSTDKKTIYKFLSKFNSKEEITDEMKNIFLDKRIRFLDKLQKAVSEYKTDDDSLTRVKYLMKKYNELYMNLDEKIVDQFFVNKFDATATFKKIKDIKHKIELFNIPNLYKTWNENFDLKEEERLKALSVLDKEIKKLDKEFLRTIIK